VKPTLEGSLRILEDALDVAYSRCRAAAGAAEDIDAELCQQLLNMSGSLGEFRYDVAEALQELDAMRNPRAAASDHPEGPS